jgi:hypothetical protein
VKRAPFCSPLGLLLAAAFLAMLLGIAHLAGLRDHTTVFSLTGGGSPALGATYAILYLGCVLVAPVLALAGLLLWVLNVFGRRRRVEICPGRPPNEHRNPPS